MTEVWREDAVLAHAVRSEMIRSAADFLELGSGNCSFTVHLAGCSDGNDRIVKVPYDDPSSQAIAASECKILDFLADTKEQCPLIIPNVLHKNVDPFYYVLSYVPGEVHRYERNFSPGERYFLGKSLGELAMWSARIDPGAFIAQVGQPHQLSFDWRKLFSQLEGFEESNYPSLSEVSKEMLALRDVYCPAEYPAAGTEQIIHGDSRLPNLTFIEGAEGVIVKGALDWAVAHIGTAAEEARAIYEFGADALTGFNDVLDAHNRPPVDLEAVRFWRVGRTIAAIVRQVCEGKHPENYMRARGILMRDRPDLKWTELPPSQKQSLEYIGESGPMVGYEVMI